MSTTTKVQRIIRKTREPWYVTLPASIAQTMGFTKSEAVEWTVTDEHHLVLSRSPVAPVMPVTPELVDVGVKKKSSWVSPIGWGNL
jgi:antitoxin component of MazEF toxin-antitoxin module